MKNARMLGSLCFTAIALAALPPMALAAGATGPVGAPGPFVERDPIAIDGDEDEDGNSSFTANNGVVGGSGTEDDPYVIEGWRIDLGNIPDADGDGTPDFNAGISVANTDKHILIRNVLVEGEAAPSFAHGIGSSFSSPNVTVSRVTVRFANTGIEGTFHEVSSSLVSECADGIGSNIAVNRANARRVLDNISTQNAGVGIYNSVVGNEMIVARNTVTENGGEGIHTEGARQIIDANEVSDNGSRGLTVGAGAVTGLEGHTDVINNVIRRNNGFGLDIFGGQLVKGNFLDANVSGGITTSAFPPLHLVVRNSWIADNRFNLDRSGDGVADTVGIQLTSGQPVQSGLLVGSTCHTIEGSEWLNGVPSIDSTVGHNVVDAGADKSGTVGVPVVFYDPTNPSPGNALIQLNCAAPSSVHWIWGDGTVGFPASGASASLLAQASHAYAKPGVYEVEMMVILQGGLRLSDRVKVTIEP